MAQKVRHRYRVSIFYKCDMRPFGKDQYITLSKRCGDERVFEQVLKRVLGNPKATVDRDAHGLTFNVTYLGEVEVQPTSPKRRQRKASQLTSTRSDVPQPSQQQFLF